MILDEKTISDALNRLTYLSNQVTEINRVSDITKMDNPHRTEIIKEHKKLHKIVSEYFELKKDASKQAVSTMTEILNRRRLRITDMDEDGKGKKSPMVHLGLDFIHEHFNNGNLFPLGTFMSLVAGSGVGKSDYLYRMANSFLMQNYKVMLCSFEFGEDRLSEIADDEKHGGKDRMKESRQADMFDNLFVNYFSRDMDSLETLIDMAHENGIQVILIDSFGEIERDQNEYMLQQNYSMMLNAKANDYGIFIATIAQTNASENEGEYKVRGGTDLLYKPDIAIHVKKISAEDTTGERIVHLFKNRDADLNGKTIITKYDFEKREPTYKCDYQGVTFDGKQIRSGFGGGRR